MSSAVVLGVCGKFIILWFYIHPRRAELTIWRAMGKRIQLGHIIISDEQQDKGLKKEINFTLQCQVRYVRVRVSPLTNYTSMFETVAGQINGKIMSTRRRRF